MAVMSMKSMLSLDQDDTRETCGRTGGIVNSLLAASRKSKAARRPSQAMADLSNATMDESKNGTGGGSEKSLPNVDGMTGSGRTLKEDGTPAEAKEDNTTEMKDPIAKAQQLKTHGRRVTTGSTVTVKKSNTSIPPNTPIEVCIDEYV